MSDLVSVVIPSYNYGRFLPETIESALAQTHAPLEIVVVDDGSEEDTEEVARRYAVTLVTQENRGEGAAWNTGIRASHGGLYVPLDADDRLHPECVERTPGTLLRSPEYALA